MSLIKYKVRFAKSSSYLSYYRPYTKHCFRKLQQELSLVHQMLDNSTYSTIKTDYWNKKLISGIILNKSRKPKWVWISILVRMIKTLQPKQSPRVKWITRNPLNNCLASRPSVRKRNRLWTSKSDWKWRRKNKKNQSMMQRELNTMSKNNRHSRIYWLVKALRNPQMTWAYRNCSSISIKRLKVRITSNITKMLLNLH